MINTDNSVTNINNLENAENSENRSDTKKAAETENAADAEYAADTANRKNPILNWDDYFMAMAHLAAFRSKDPNTQVGACIVNDQKRVVGLGYNGFPYGCSDEEYPWEREGDFLNTKYPYVVHAELNAILNSIQNLQGCTLYVSLFPCNECAKAIIQSGIGKVVYESDKYEGSNENIASKKMFRDAGVKLQKLNHSVKVQAGILSESKEEKTSIEIK